MNKEMYSLMYNQDGINCVFGRPLGFIDRKQFYDLYTQPKRFVRKLLSLPTVTFEDIVESGSLVRGHRFIFGTTNEVFTKTLFVSAELSYITSIDISNPLVVDLEMIDKNRQILYLERKLPDKT